MKTFFQKVRINLLSLTASVAARQPPSLCASSVTLPAAARLKTKHFMALFKFKRLSILDNLELFSSEDECSYFPFHFHDVFCISIVTKGVEQFTTNDRHTFIQRGHISITNPGEVHQNQSALPLGYSYKTIYASPDLLNHLNGGKPVGSIQRMIDDPELFAQLNSLIRNEEPCAAHWQQSIASLLRYQERSKQTQRKKDRFAAINEVAHANEDERISAKKLSSLFHLSPHHFIREFKKAIGLTPQAFLMLKRLGKVKKELLITDSLKDIAWSNGFFDVTHLNYSFKKFFGVTISAYKNSNILH
jgi:AraC-like DNA-binding protein